MLGKGMTVSEATHRWVQEFNRFPQDMISKLMSIDIDGWHEVTKPSAGRRVYVFNLPEEKPDGTPYDGTENCGEISECVDEDTYIVELDDGESVMVKGDDLELEEDSCLPMWGTMWQFGDSADDYWLEEMDGIQVMSECAFRTGNVDCSGMIRKLKRRRKMQMRKIYRKLTKEQKEAGVVFSSCLSPVKYETGTIHEVKADDPDRENKIRNLKDDKFFNGSQYKYNIIRT